MADEDLTERQRAFQQAVHSPARYECSGCGRKTWQLDALGKLCNMTQPDMTRCTGRFVPVTIRRPG